MTTSLDHGGDWNEYPVTQAEVKQNLYIHKPRKELVVTEKVKKPKPERRIRYINLKR